MRFTIAPRRLALAGLVLLAAVVVAIARTLFAWDPVRPDLAWTVITVSLGMITVGLLLHDAGAAGEATGCGACSRPLDTELSFCPRCGAHA